MLIQGCSQLSGIIQDRATEDDQNAVIESLVIFHQESKITWKNPSSSSAPFTFLSFPVFFSSPFSFPLMLHLCDANTGPVASAQSHGLFWADVTTALHNLCLSCSLQSRFLCAHAALCCTDSELNCISQDPVNTELALNKKSQCVISC